MISALKRFIRRKTPVKTVIWGVRVPEKVKIRWLMLAAIMRVPTNRLVTYALQDWVQQNADNLTDEVARNRLADYITQLYLSNKLK